MKKIFFIIMIFACISSAAMTWSLDGKSTADMWGDSTGNGKAFAKLWGREVESIIETAKLDEGMMQFTPADSLPAEANGLMYYDDVNSVMKYYNGTSWVSAGVGTFAGGTITSDVTMTNGEYIRPDTTTAHILGLQVYDVDNTAWKSAVKLTNGDVADVNIGESGVTGQFHTANWSIDTAGDIDARDLTVDGNSVIGGSGKTFAVTSSGLNVTSTGVVTGQLCSVLNKTSAYECTAADSGKVVTNAGAGGAVAITLPTAAAGYRYTFILMAAQELRITPAAGDAIKIGTSAGDAAEYFVADAVGETVTLVAVDATNWVATSYIGTWSQQTP